MVGVFLVAAMVVGLFACHCEICRMDRDMDALFKKHGYRRGFK